MRRLFVYIVLLHAGTTYCFAQTSNCTITGTIRHLDGSPAANTQVEIVKAEQNGNPMQFSAYSVQSDANGLLTFFAPRSSWTWVQANNVQGFNTLGGIPFQIPDAPTAALESLWLLNDGVTTFNGRAADVMLTYSDIVAALGYIPTSATGVIGAINSSTEATKLQLRTTGGEALLKFMPSDSSVGGFNFSVAQGINPSSPIRDWSLTMGYNQQPDGSGVVMPGEPALSYRIESNYVQNGSSRMSASLRYVDATGRLYQPYNYSIDRATNSIDVIQQISTMSMLDSATGSQWMEFQNQNILLFGPTAIRSLANNVIPMSQLNAAGNLNVPLFYLNSNDQLFLAPVSTAIFGSNLEVPFGGISVGKDLPYPDAAIDINGGDSRGLRLQPRSTSGAPTSGTWSQGTIILDAKGVPYVCVLAGTPGLWNRMLSQPSSTGVDAAVSYNFTTSTGGLDLIKYQPSEPKSGAFNMTVHSGGNAASTRPDWVTTWGYNQGSDGALPEKSGEPAFSHRIESYWAPSQGVEMLEAHLQYVNAAGRIYRPYGYYINRNSDYIQEDHQISAFSMIDAGSGVQYVRFQQPNILLTAGGALKSLTNNVSVLNQLNAAGTQTVPLIYLNSADRVVVAPSSTAQFGSNAIIPGSLSVGTTAPSVDAEVDVAGGDTKGLRVRPRSGKGAPSTGTWNVGTMIVDRDGTLYICSLSGTPGGWQKVGTQ